MKYIDPTEISQLESNGNYRELRQIDRERKNGHLTIGSTVYPTSSADIQTAEHILSGVTGDQLFFALQQIRFDEEAGPTVDTLIRYNRVRRNVLSLINKTYERTKTIHPDDYTFSDHSFDDIHRGITSAGIDSDKVLQNAEAYFNRIGKELPGMVERSDKTTGVSNLLELYGLAQTLGEI